MTTTPTSQQDELRLRLFINNLPGLDSEAEAALWGKITEYVDRTVAERVLAIIGEDEVENPKGSSKPEGLDKSYDIGCYMRVGRNKLRAELRAAVQTQGNQK